MATSYRPLISAHPHGHDHHGDVKRQIEGLRLLHHGVDVTGHVRVRVAKDLQPTTSDLFLLRHTMLLELAAIEGHIDYPVLELRSLVRVL